MWHEARRRERATQKLFSDQKKRAEKRREENRVDPNSLLQVSGVKSKIHIDSSTYKLAENSMLVWQGDNKTTIDRFDVRTTLNSLPSEDRSAKARSEKDNGSRHRKPQVLDANENEFMRKILNFERYCLVMQNDINKVSESKRLDLVQKKSDLLSEAEMRKLKNNWFGTSGETSISSDNVPGEIRNNNSRLQGISIAYEYNQCSTITDIESSQADTINGLLVTDLDDRDSELDLDCVDKVDSNAKNTKDAINQYGLNCDEYNLLIDMSKRSVKEIIDKLKQVNDKLKQRCHPERTHENDQDYYGPSLPPEMVKRLKNRLNRYRANDATKSQTPCVTSDTPVTTIEKETASKEISSYVGMNQTPIKVSRDPTRPVTNAISRSVNTSSRNHLYSNLPSSSNSKDLNQKPSTSGRSELLAPNHTTNNSSNDSTDGKKPEEHVQIGREPDDRPKNGRRASTPLAYKRYRRSSRSMSRERGFSSRHLSSSSSSSSSHSTRSENSCSPSTSSSSDVSYHSRTRRRRVAPRSPGYRRSRRHRHRLSERDIYT